MPGKPSSVFYDAGQNSCCWESNLLRSQKIRSLLGVDSLELYNPSGLDGSPN